MKWHFFWNACLLHKCKSQLSSRFSSGFCNTLWIPLIPMVFLFGSWFSSLSRSFLSSFGLSGLFISASLNSANSFQCLCLFLPSIWEFDRLLLIKMVARLLSRLTIQSFFFFCPVFPSFKDLLRPASPLPLSICHFRSRLSIIIQRKWRGSFQ